MALKSRWRFVFTLILLVFLFVSQTLIANTPSKTIRIEVLEGTEVYWERIIKTFKVSHPEVDIQFTKFSEQKLRKAVQNPTTQHDTIRMVKYTWWKKDESIQAAVKDLSAYEKVFRGASVWYIKPFGQVVGTRWLPEWEWFLVISKSSKFAKDTRELLMFCSQYLPTPTSPSLRSITEEEAKNQLKLLATQTNRPVPEDDKSFGSLLVELLKSTTSVPYGVIKASVGFVTTTVWDWIKGAIVAKIATEASVDLSAVVAKGVAISANAHIGPNARIWPNNTLGSYTYIGANVDIRDGGTIGERVQIADGTTIQARATIDARTRIGAFVDIGEDADIDEDVRILSFSTIGRKSSIWRQVLICGGTTIGEKVSLKQHCSIYYWVQIGHNFTLGKRGDIFFGARIGNHVTIGDDARIWGFNVKIGNNVAIGNYARISHRVSIADKVTIEDNVTLKSGVTIEQNVKIGKAVILKKNAKIGAGATIGDKVTIGAGATIKPGATVPNNTTVQPGTIYP